SHPHAPPRITLLVADRTGYRNLCRLLTAAARDRPKGEARADLDLLAKHAGGLHCLTGGDEGPLTRLLVENDGPGATALLDRLATIFPRRLHIELQRHHRRQEEACNRARIELAGRLRLPLLATNGVRFARSTDKDLHDVLTALRHRTQLDAAGRLLAAHRECHFKAAAEMADIFADIPHALSASVELAEQLDFTLANLGYRFPDYPLPPGETPSSYLRHITWNEARARFRPLTARAQAQIEKELAMIDSLGLAGYFLIVWDIIRFCKRERILVQGRGSAANSAVCYALSITAVDPVKMELLFERFLSAERGEWPDIDLDLPSGDQREKVIQYVYRRYGPHGAAMTANVITYRNRSAARETAKALGFSHQQQDRLSKQLGSWHYDLQRGDKKSLAEELAAAGLDPSGHRARLFARLWQRIHNLPRHLGQHSGGMVIAAGRLDEIVPLEPAAMDGRVVVQWDKDDCADLGIIKVDLLGLGMLQALEEMIPLISTHEGRQIDLAHLPQDDPATYEMLRRADTVGVFQVESRAQMASLPRNNPQRFYDLVIQVAIIRPGPIAGGLVHPYFERRNGRQLVTCIHPCLESILKRTLGVPIFQEQILRIAMEAAGFTGGEAEELRRAMGFKRSTERMQQIEARLRAGMAARGITGASQEQIVQSITSFALYGFPESHAASFALIAYASAYLRCHHPTAFYTALLNAWPMGFYHPATLVKDAQRHDVDVRPIDVNHSAWRCRWEATARTGREEAHRTTPNTRAPSRSGSLVPSPPPGALRLGLRYIRGLREIAGQRIACEQPFSDADDLARRCRLRDDELTTLAESGALAPLGLTRRQALWQVAWVTKPSAPLFERNDTTYTATSSSPRALRSSSPLPEMTSIEETIADYRVTGVTVGDHPMAHFRRRLTAHGIRAAADLEQAHTGDLVRIAGAIIVRQRPGTAKGVLFITLEDETGMVQAIVPPDLLHTNRAILLGSSGIVVEGILQRRDGSLSVQARSFQPLDLGTVRSHDFH
ncbi:MAG: error-prone DNA polymerase, partial [Acidobacteriota bacterium]|nr:error-prone DNA polymerase [Acidobacteriota bacterium]